jgi:multiple sugar transport system permease protein
MAIVSKVLRYALLIVLSLIFLLPFYIMIRNSLMTQAEITDMNQWRWLPEELQWGNFPAVFEDKSISMATGLRVSAILALVNLIFQTLFASMAGFALARIPFRGREIVFAMILLTLMIPGAVTFVPTYVVVSNLGGINTLWGIVVPGLFSAFTCFLFRQFYLDFPTEIEEAGRLDGNS